MKDEWVGKVGGMEGGRTAYLKVKARRCERSWNVPRLTCWRANNIFGEENGGNGEK